MSVRLLFLALLVYFVPASAQADSDGYFCTAKGLLVIEKRFSWGQTGHVVEIIRLGPAGIASPEVIDLAEDFQTHGLICSETRVEVIGWDKIHHIDISTPAAAKLIERAPIAPGSQVQPPQNLADWSRAGVIVLGSIAGDERFELVIAKASRRLPGRGVETYTISELVYRDRVQIRDSMRLFVGVFREPAGQ